MQGNKIIQKIKGLPSVVYMLVTLVVAFSAMSLNYLMLVNFKNVLTQAAPLMTVALEQTCIVLTQEIDLPLGAQVNPVAVFIMWIALWGTPLPAAILLAILSITLIGVVNSMIAARGSILPLIVIYGMQSILNSPSLLLTTGSSIYFQGFIYRIITETIILGIPLMVWAAVLVSIMVWVVLNEIRSGINIYRLGGSREALQLTDTNPIICLIETYVFAGSVIGVAGVITLSHIEVGMPMAVMGWEFRAVIVTLLGGASLREGESGVTGMILGAFPIQVIGSGLNIVGVQSVKQSAITDSTVLIAIIIDTAVRTRSKE